MSQCVRNAILMSDFNEKSLLTLAGHRVADDNAARQSRIWPFFEIRDVVKNIFLVHSYLHKKAL